MPVTARLGVAAGIGLLLGDRTHESLAGVVMHGAAVGVLVRVLIGIVQWQADMVAHSTEIKSLGEHDTLFESVYLYAVILKFFSLDAHLRLVQVLAECDCQGVSVARMFGLVIGCVSSAWQVCLPVLAIGLSLQCLTE